VDVDDDAREESRVEWLELEREVQDIKHKAAGVARVAAGGQLREVATYDDVAGEQVPDENPSIRPFVERPGADSDSDAGRGARTARDLEANAADAVDSAFSTRNASEDPGLAPAAVATTPTHILDSEATGDRQADAVERPLPSVGVTTAGAVSSQEKVKQRGGSKNKKKDEDAQGGKQKGKKRDDDDEENDRFKKMRLEGDEKPKRIDTTRIVTYRDYDSTGSRPASAQVLASGVQPAAADFRAQLRRDLFDEEDDDSD